MHISCLLFQWAHYSTNSMDIFTLLSYYTSLHIIPGITSLRQANLFFVHFSEYLRLILDNNVDKERE